MVEHCRACHGLHWLGAVIVALASTGLRISELASLRWTDLDLRSKTIRLTDERASRRCKGRTVRRFKGRRGRSLPVHDVLKPDTVRFIREVIKPLKERFPTPPEGLGFEHGRMHGFRHYFSRRRSGAAPRKPRSKNGWGFFGKGGGREQRGYT
jgi:integrase